MDKNIDTIDFDALIEEMKDAQDDILKEAAEMQDRISDMLDTLTKELTSSYVASDGKTYELELADYIEYEGVEYACFLASTENDDERDFCIGRDVVYGEDGEIKTFTSVTDSSLAEKIYQLFIERNKDYYTFD